MQNRRILFAGDIVGRRGRDFLMANIEKIKKKYAVDFVIANGENAAGGYGLTKKIFYQMMEAGIDCITSGNHIWAKKEIVDVMKEDSRLLRPLNYPPDVPGQGYGIYGDDNPPVAVINLMGRIFLEPVDCPFRKIEEILPEIKKITPIIIVDFHAEATAEKIAMKYFLDGRVTAVIGTHTHVQTADEEITSLGTCYITDAGMTGPVDSVIGMKIEDSIKRMITRIPKRVEPAKGKGKLEGVIIDVDKNGECLHIERLREYE